MKISVLFALLFSVLLAHPAGTLIKRHYGGNIRVADSLTENIEEYALWSESENSFKPSVPLPFEMDEKSASLDLSSLNPEWMAEIEQSVLRLQNHNHECHWILDYPYFDHRHPTSITIESGKLKVSTIESDFLQIVLLSNCLNLSEADVFRPFRRTQFGYEANQNCIAGRPFLDSITPSPVDPTNPYLAFKLNDVDVIPVPEERFLQLLGDLDMNLIPAMRYFVYLQISGFTQSEASAFMQSTSASQAAQTVLNGHANVLISDSQGSRAGLTKEVRYIIPQDEPYKLLAQRMIVGWEELGFKSAAPENKTAPAVIVAVEEMSESTEDAFRYKLLRDRLMITGSKPWYEVWDEMEAAGALIPVLIHQSMIAARSNIRDLKSKQNGHPDFANAWLQPEQ